MSWQSERIISCKKESIVAGFSCAVQGNRCTTQEKPASPLKPFNSCFLYALLYIIILFHRGRNTISIKTVQFHQHNPIASKNAFISSAFAFSILLLTTISRLAIFATSGFDNMNHRLTCINAVNQRCLSKTG